MQMQVGARGPPPPMGAGSLAMGSQGMMMGPMQGRGMGPGPGQWGGGMIPGRGPGGGYPTHGVLLSANFKRTSRSKLPLGSRGPGPLSSKM